MQNDMRITSILQTHGHVDHVCGLRETKNMLPNVPIFAHNDDWYVIKTAPLQGN
jgi:glyoxylase-like metal-dependent hydrolase (beta-lactamase superfamily II)